MAHDCLGPCGTDKRPGTKKNTVTHRGKLCVSCNTENTAPSPKMQGQAAGRIRATGRPPSMTSLLNADRRIIMDALERIQELMAADAGLDPQMVAWINETTRSLTALSREFRAFLKDQDAWHDNLTPEEVDDVIRTTVGKMPVAHAAALVNDLVDDLAKRKP